MDGLTADGLRVEEAPAPYRVAPLLTDHLDTFAAAPEGFKRLRELVLNLAVRGRLVPQDPNDEPAEKLLARIRSINNRVVLAPEDSAPYEVPPSWVWTTLGEITNVGETIKADVLHNDTWVLDLEDIEKDTSKVLCKVRFSERQSKSDKNTFSVGDVLYGKLRPYLNKVIVADEPGVCTTEILPLRGYESIDANYIKTFLKNPEFIEYVNAKSYGMKMPRLGTTDAKRAHFALPPLAEQSRIVAKVEELMGLIDALEAKVGAGETARGRLLDALLAALADSPDAAATADAWAQLAPHFELLLQTPADVDRLQQTLLTLAVKGRLVPQDPKDEPAAELLKRIRAEKERLVAEGKIKREKLLPAIGEGEKPFDLPEAWQWAKLGAIGDVGSSSRVHQKDWKTCGVPFYRAREIVRLSGYGTVDNELFITEEHFHHLSQHGFVPRANDIMITGVGTIGVPYVVQISDKFYFKDASVLIFKNHYDLPTEFLLYLMKSPYWIRQIHIGSMGTTVHTLTIGRLSEIPIPLPPLAEQSRIVAAVASLTALCDRLRERLAARRDLSAKLAAALTESALV